MFFFHFVDNSKGIFKKLSLFSKLVLLIHGFFFLYILGFLIIYSWLINFMSYYNSTFNKTFFLDLYLGREWLFRCSTMKLEALRLIVRCHERVVVVRPRNILFSLEKQCPRGRLSNLEV